MSKSIVGTNTMITIAGVPKLIPAKIDTGADGTAIWASDIYLSDDGVLHYTFFDKQSPLYTGESHTTDDFRITKVTSSTGHDEIRFKVRIQITLGDKKIKVWCSLTDRSSRIFPVLIGKKTLNGKFLVDVSKYKIKPVRKKLPPKITEEFRADPQAFIKKHKDSLTIKARYNK